MMRILTGLFRNFWILLIFRIAILDMFCNVGDEILWGPWSMAVKFWVFNLTLKKIGYSSLRRRFVLTFVVGIYSGISYEWRWLVTALQRTCIVTISHVTCSLSKICTEWLMLIYKYLSLWRTLWCRASMPSQPKSNLLDVLLRTWYLGFTSFGGPVVHFQIFHRMFVEGQDPWLDEQTVRYLSSPSSIFGFF